jgi:hypothetical protein
MFGSPLEAAKRATKRNRLSSECKVDCIGVVGSPKGLSASGRPGSLYGGRW